eukprot:NODE_1023_length_2588_cov_0.371635.p1 type:complete len:151 gc:universal NODE_1023_length_2588_cov_0.371635:664-1116(+)
MIFSLTLSALVTELASASSDLKYEQLVISQENDFQCCLSSGKVYCRPKSSKTDFYMMSFEQKSFQALYVEESNGQICAIETSSTETESDNTHIGISQNATTVTTTGSTSHVTTTYFEVTRVCISIGKTFELSVAKAPAKKVAEGIMKTTQ